jgi:hypothetical protein
MKTRLLILFVVLVFLIFVFIWSSTNYLIRYTDTPSELPPELYVQNLDVFAFPAVFAAFAIIGITPVITWMMIKDHKHRRFFTALSEVGIFFAFVGIFILIIQSMN